MKTPAIYDQRKEKNTTHHHPRFLICSFISINPLQALLATTAVVATTLLLVSESKFADAVDNTLDTSLAGGNLARCAGVAGRHIHAWVLSEEVSGAQEHCHGLCGHDGVVLWCWEMGEAEGVPEHYVSVVERGAGVCGEPGWKALGRLA